MIYDSLNFTFILDWAFWKKELLKAVVFELNRTWTATRFRVWFAAVCYEGTSRLFPNVTEGASHLLIFIFCAMCARFEGRRTHVQEYPHLWDKKETSLAHCYNEKPASVVRFYPASICPTTLRFEFTGCKPYRGYPSSRSTRFSINASYKISQCSFILIRQHARHTFAESVDLLSMHLKPKIITLCYQLWWNILLKKTRVNLITRCIDHQLESTIWRNWWSKGSGPKYQPKEPSDLLSQIACSMN